MIVVLFFQGKSKYALEEDTKDEKPDFREGLHKHDDKAEDEEGEAEEGGEVSTQFSSSVTTSSIS